MLEKRWARRFNFVTKTFRLANASSSSPVFTTGMVFCGFLVGHHCLLAATGTARELKTVAARISLAFSSTPALVKRNVEPRSSQQSGWSCHTEERAGSNFGKVRWYHNWLMLNIFFASAAVDSELGVENFVVVFKYSVFLYFHCSTVVV